MATNIQGIADDLCLESKQVNALEDDVVIVVLEEWVFSLLRYGILPPKGSLRTSASHIPADMLHGKLFHGKIDSPWRKLLVQVIAKPEDGSILQVPQIRPDSLLKPDLEFLEFLQCVNKLNYEKNWRAAYDKHSKFEFVGSKGRSSKTQLVDLKDVLQILYQCPIIQTQGVRNFSGTSQQPQTTIPNPNMTPALCVLESPKAFYLLQSFTEHTLQSCVTLSPVMLGQSYAKPLFVVYQILQVMQYCHQMGVPCGDLRLKDFTVDSKLWVKMKGPRWKTLLKYSREDEDRSKVEEVMKHDQIEPPKKCVEDEVKDSPEDRYGRWNLESLPELVMQWVTGKLSNYDYLMILNHLAGRRMGQSNHHPVLPWVMDFTRPDGSYRDLTKSKYRLNKGDCQLDITYDGAVKMAASTVKNAIDTPFNIEPPHHISQEDLLSEITYFIYNARRTPKSVLCNNVRAQFVPREYPSSMERMQKWTPDECIPEFYNDPDIFVSRHEDLGDLEVPSWCSGPGDFLRKHLAVLEGDYVSERLHRWIDITFGYKLSGNAAVKAKNIHIHLVKQHTEPTTHGVVQLFNVPHPKRVAKSYYMGPNPPVIKAKRAQLVESVSMNKGVEAEKDQVPVQEASSIVSGLVASMEGLMGTELNDSTAIVQEAGDGMVPEGAGIDTSIEESVESSVGSESSVDVSQRNGRISSVSTDTSTSILTVSGSMDDSSIQQTKNPIKKFSLFRSRGDNVDTKPSIPRPETQTFALPDDYDPLASLTQLETLYTFSSKALHGIPVVDEKVKPCDISQECLTNDMLALGCIIAELFLAPKLRMQNPSASLEERVKVLQKMMTANNIDLPRSVKRIINMLLTQANGDKSRDYDLQILTPSLLLQPFTDDIIPFPRYFPGLYEFISELHLASSSTDRVYNDGLLSRRQAMAKVQIAARCIPQVLRSIKIEGKDVLLPYLVELFSDSDTALPTALLVLNKVMQYYGPEASRISFREPLVKIYDADFTSTNSVLLFHRSFVSQLMVRLGLQMFLEKLLDFVVSATSGIKYCPRFDETIEDPIGVMRDTGRARFLSEAKDAFDFFNKGGSFPGRSFMMQNSISEKGDHERSDSPKLEITGVSDDDDDVLMDESDSRKDQSLSGDSSSLDAMSLSEERSSQSDETSTKPVSEMPSGSVVKETSGVAKEADRNTEDGSIETKNNANDQDTVINGASKLEDTSSEQLDSAEKESSPKDPEITAVDGSNQSQILADERASPIPSKVHFATNPQDLPENIQFGLPTDFAVSTMIDLSPGSTMVNVAVDTVMWLAHRIGPALTATHLSDKLLKALAQCYLGRGQLSNCDDDSDSESSDDEYGVSLERKTVQGDLNAKAVLCCLMDIALLYGDQFIFQQFFPFIHDTVKIVKKVNAKIESSLVACVVLLKHLLPYLQDTQLMDNLKMIFKKILQPLIHVISSSHLSFPTGGLPRSVIAFKLVDVITTIALRIGREMTREHMTGLLQQFFVCFELVHGENGLPGNMSSPEYERERNTSCYSTDSEEMYCEIKVDSSGGSSNQYKVGTPTKLEYLKGEMGEELARSPIRSTLIPRLSGDHLDQLEDGKWCDPTIMVELQEAFTPELAHTAYIPLCRLTGSIHMESKLYNHDMVWKLSNTHEKELAAQAATEAALAQQAGANPDDPSLRQTSWFVDIGASVPAAKLEEDDDPLHVTSGEFGRNVAIVGNRIDIYQDSESSDDEGADESLSARQRLKSATKKQSEKKDNLSAQMGKSSRQLKGNWLSYWEQFIAKGELDDTYQFTQLKLQTFVGHTAGIRALCTLGNENSFVSASKDKMVKLWSLRNQGDGSHKSQCRYTYSYHKKTVFAATFLEAPRLVATCDGVIHVWDPFTGAVVRQYDLTRGSPSLIVKLPAPSPMLVAAMADATVRFIDTRHHSVQHEFKVAASPLGLIRCLAVSDDGSTLGVGLSSGVISMVDIRTGLLLGGWRAHEGEVLQIKSCSNNTFLTTSVDQSIAMWKEDGQRVCSFRGASEPVQCVQISNGQIVSATTANRIGIHSSLDQNAAYYSTRIRSDVLKGAISAMEVLPLNKQLLLASDNGTITLIA